MQSALSTEQGILCDLCSNVLFNKKTTLSTQFDADELLSEAKYQTVFPIACAGIKNQAVQSSFYDNIVRNVRVNYYHTEISEILSKNNIPYVILKGVASASYYKEPVIRTMGDVDVLINPCDIKKADELLQTLGYSTDDDIHKLCGHIGYSRNADGLCSICEVHFNVNGIPKDLSHIFNRYFEDIFKAARQIRVANGSCSVPSDFHHGIILLLHTATHLTSEGIGLRHLCDWAVFVNGFSSDEFVKMFEKPLKEMGMWRFAQLLTLCCQRFLGVDNKEWAGSVNNEFLDDMLADILNGGNFGVKDKDRYGQIKYIFNREKRKVAKDGIIQQLLLSINAKAKSEYGFVKKHKLLLPIGWIFVVFNYLVLVLLRKRRLDDAATISKANHRKNIYSEFKLFKVF